MWDAIPYKVVTRLDTSNTYVVVPLVATTAEEELKKNVHRNEILHAKQLVRDTGFDDNIGHSSTNAGENAVGSDVPLDTKQAAVMRRTLLKPSYHADSAMTPLLYHTRDRLKLTYNCHMMMVTTHRIKWGS